MLLRDIQFYNFRSKGKLAGSRMMKNASSGIQGLSQIKGRDEIAELIPMFPAFLTSQTGCGSILLQFSVTGRGYSIV
jgi:hypothetical protein